MKITLLAALALAAGLALQPALAQTPAPRTLTMSGQGVVSAVPDSVELSAGVTTQAPTAAAALSANTARMQTVFTALKKLGVADKDIQTSNFSVSPQMTQGPNQAPRLTGYQVNNQVQVHLADVGKLGGALDALVTAGANQMNGIDFTISNPAPLLTQARVQAVADAKAKAQTYAQAAGVTLGSILSINENDNQGPRQVVVTAMRVGAAAPMAAGEENVSAQVSIVWEIH